MESFLRILIILSIFLVLYCESPSPDKYLFQGDILLNNDFDIWERNAITDEKLRWTNGRVPYLIHPIYNDKEKELILNVMNEIENLTCLRFVERKEEEDYIGIYSDSGCWSELGRNGGLQLLSLEASVCLSKGVIMHELMHALGFYHEHTRYDRDEFITVHWDNIINDLMKMNFVKLPHHKMNYLEEEYDYFSVMHYTAWAFAKDRHPTLSPIRPGFTHKSLGIGQVIGKLSEVDVRKINKLYEC
uniref:Metalloendopeptidase n=1 Tax=Tityus serrulatus TaxID=6887 RepID=U6JT87_TITSE|nr:astacin-like metallopeptidase 9 protein [Tityus serrulatus]